MRLRRPSANTSTTNISVSLFALDSREYAPADGDFEDADDVEIVYGAKETDRESCGRLFYLNFVKYEESRTVETHTTPANISFDFPR